MSFLIYGLLLHGMEETKITEDPVYDVYGADEVCLWTNITKTLSLIEPALFYLRNKCQNAQDTDDGSGDESDKESDSNSEVDENLDTFFDLEVWEEIGKNIEDFTIEDMKKLEFKTRSNCLQFYKNVLESERFLYTAEASKLQQTWWTHHFPTDLV